MARVTDGLLDGFQASLTADRYQEIMQLPIAAFNGLNLPGEDPSLECANIWTQNDRDNLAMWLAVAEENRESELGYHLAPKYVVEEEHDYRMPIMLHRKHLISIGVRATSDIALAEAIIYRDAGEIIDPVEIVVDDGITYAADEIIVCYPGEDVKIRPSSVTISGTAVTISIPRSRLVRPELNDNRADHLYYIEDDNFLVTVDIKREYVDGESGVEFVWPKSYLPQFCPPTCDEVTQIGCAQSSGNRAKRIAKIEVYPANWVDGSPVGTHFTYRCAPRYVRVSYLAGVQNSPRAELLTARYAHTLMPNMPCTCPIVEQYWADDRTKLEGFTTPYGNTNGALNAWMMDSRAKIGNAGVFS